MFPQLSMQPLQTLSTTQLLPLGTVVYDPRDNARKAYRYVQFGGTSTINPGLLLVSAAAPANSTGLALPTTNTAAQLAAGSTIGNLFVTNGSTTITVPEFVDGTLEILGSGAVESYRITGHTLDTVGSAQITVEFQSPLRNTSALVAGTNTVNLRLSPSYNPAASLTQALPVGVTIMPVPNTSSVTNFGWVQIQGEALVQATSGTKGYPVVQDTSGTAGYVANTGSNLPQIGVFKEAVSSNLASVFLQLN